jgi:hypothetical protein
MADIKIVTTRPIEKEFVQQIAEVDPRIKVLDASSFSAAEDRGISPIKKNSMPCFPKPRSSADSGRPRT